MHISSFLNYSHRIRHHIYVKLSEVAFLSIKPHHMLIRFCFLISPRCSFTHTTKWNSFNFSQFTNYIYIYDVSMDSIHVILWIYSCICVRLSTSSAQSAVYSFIYIFLFRILLPYCLWQQFHTRTHTNTGERIVFLTFFVFSSRICVSPLSLSVTCMHECVCVCAYLYYNKHGLRNAMPTHVILRLEI